MLANLCAQASTASNRLRQMTEFHDVQSCVVPCRSTSRTWGSRAPTENSHWSWGNIFCWSDHVGGNQQYVGSICRTRWSPFAWTFALQFAAVYCGWHVNAAMYREWDGMCRQNGKPSVHDGRLRVLLSSQPSEIAFRLDLRCFAAVSLAAFATGWYGFAEVSTVWKIRSAVSQQCRECYFCQW